MYGTHLIIYGRENYAASKYTATPLGGITGTGIFAKRTYKD